MKNKVLSAFLFLFCGLCGGWAFVQTGYLSGAKFVCNLVHEKYFDPGQRINKWHEECLQKVDDFHLFSSKNHIVKILQHHLWQMNVSHLNLVEPIEENLLWKGVDLANGLRIRLIDGQFVVWDILPKSSAFEAGFRVGDVLLQLDGQILSTPGEVERESGVFLISRQDKQNDKQMNLRVKTQSLKLDESPKIVKMREGLGKLSIPSFRKDFFANDSWNSLIAQTKSYQGLVIDLRGNPGGSFVAMMRSLSSFLCTPTAVGKIIKQNLKSSEVRDLADDIEETSFFTDLEVSSTINLKSFTGYECYSGKLYVVIDHDSSSVAEIFAQAIQSTHRGFLYGERSAGQVLLSVWYDLPQL